jgi:uncharacterized phage-associated protein
MRIEGTSFSDDPVRDVYVERGRLRRMQWGTFKAEKALEVLLYILSKGCTNMYNVLKVVYFADKAHLKRTGHTLFKDRYIAMRNGPVPSGTYDLIKAIRGRSQFNDYHSLVKGTLAFENEASCILKPLRSPNLRMFSSADFLSLDEAISKYGYMSFEDLKNTSHQEIDFQRADENDLMSFDLFVQSVDENGSIRSFLQDCLEEAVC